jgi:hypothetical protein
MVEFVRTRTGGRLILDDAESDLIMRVAGELRSLLTTTPNTDDPVVERLLPDAFEDRIEQAKYQDLIGDDLVTFKIEALDAVSESLSETGSDVEIEGEALHRWLSVLTDMRLAIGTRLQVDEEMMGAEIDPEDPNGPSLAVLHWLGWIQEGIIRTCGGL